MLGAALFVQRETLPCNHLQLWVDMVRGAEQLNIVCNEFVTVASINNLSQIVWSIIRWTNLVSDHNKA